MIAIALGKAFDSTLVRLARELRDLGNDGHRKSKSSGMSPLAIAQASGAALYLDAHESIMAGILAAFVAFDLNDQSSGSSSMLNRKVDEKADLLQRRQAWFEGELQVLGEAGTERRKAAAITVTGNKQSSHEHQKAPLLANLNFTVLRVTLLIGRLRIHSRSMDCRAITLPFDAQ